MSDPIDSSSSPTDTHSLRDAYEHEVRDLGRLADCLRAKGMPLETIARTLHRERRAIAIRYKRATPKTMRLRIAERTVARYGNRAGPTIAQLRRAGRSWEDIIASAQRPGTITQFLRSVPVEGA